MQRLFHRSAAILLIASVLDGGSSCSASPHDTAGWVGANYTPAYAVNQVQFWHDFRPGFVFFDDCHRHEGIHLDEPNEPIKGYHNGRWAGQGGSGYLPLGPPGMKMVAGDAKWTDYVFEGRVMLKSEQRGNAGLIFRVNDAGPGYDQMRGYYVGLDTRKLYLGKMDNNWQPLAEFDLGKLDCKVQPDVWNQIRVAAEGPRIRVWLNRMHPSTDPDRGLRIDFTDEKEPILSGAIGVRAHLVPAWFDNIVVVPVEVR